MTQTHHLQITMTNLDRQEKPLGRATHHPQADLSFFHKIASRH